MSDVDVEAEDPTMPTEPALGEAIPEIEEMQDPRERRRSVQFVPMTAGDSPLFQFPSGNVGPPRSSLMDRFMDIQGGQEGNGGKQEKGGGRRRRSSLADYVSAPLARAMGITGEGEVPRGRLSTREGGRSSIVSNLGSIIPGRSNPMEDVDTTMKANKVSRYSSYHIEEMLGEPLGESFDQAGPSELAVTVTLPPPAPVVADDEAPKEEEDAGRLTPWLGYEPLQWTLFFVLTGLAVADRFGWNVWPRQTYTIGTGSAGGDRLVGYKPGPWSVVLYDCLARVSGRYSILCYNFLLIYRLECLEQLLTSPFVSRYLLDTSNIVNANLRLHYWNGIGLCVMTLLHIWSILFPCLTHGYTAVVVPGVFEWPLSERTPVKCSKSDEPGCWPGDANPELKQMGLQADDVFRMVEMTLFLAVLMPISVRWFASRWHAGIQLHRIINLVYFVDIVRRHSHPHSWILNTPVFVLYLLDAYVFKSWFRRNKSPTVKRVRLSPDFMVLYWQSPGGITDTVGPDYALLMNNSSLLEERHAFTCFENRSRTPLGDDADAFDWTVGVVVRVFRRARSPRLGVKDAISHTARMYDEEPAMLVTGPRQGEMSEMVRLELLSDDRAPLVLLGAGSAVNFIVDALQWCAVNKPRRHDIVLVYTTRDYELFKWATECFSNLIPPCEDQGVFFEVKMAFTGSLEDDGDDEQRSEDGAPGDATAKTNARATKSPRATMGLNRHKAVKTQAVRIDLCSEITRFSTVFCQGSAGLKTAVSAVCTVAGARFYGGRGGAREDLV